MAKKNRMIYVAIALLLVYFMAQTAVDAFLSFYVPGSGDTSWLSQAVRLHPLGSEAHMMMGFSALEQGKQTKRSDLLVQAVGHLKTAIRYNPFVYQAHLNLGKAYFLLSETEPHWVSDGIVSFKRAASIRGANLSVAMDSARLFFSLWPLLKKEDQDFARSLVLGIMHRIGKNDFESLVELWSLYNRKIELMEELIARRPEFSQLVAQALVRNRQYNEQRRRLLNTHDEIRYHQIKKKVDEELNKPAENQDSQVMLALFRDLGQVYRHYDRLSGEELFPEKSRMALRRRLGERLLALLIDDEGKWRNTAVSRQPVDTVVNGLINDSQSYENVFELEERLGKIGYYREGDIKSFMARMRILFQTARYDQVIDQIETFQRQVSFVREDAREDMVELLFLLNDAYRQSRLLTMASKVLDAIKPLSPAPERLLWQRFLIEKVIAVEADATLIENWRAQFAASRVIQVGTKQEKRVVYLDENREITLILTPELMEKIQTGDYNLLELNVDGRIVWDTYLGEESLYTYAFPDSFDSRAVNVEILLK
jgi:hypothetical protein